LRVDDGGEVRADAALTGQTLDDLGIQASDAINFSRPAKARSKRDRLWNDSLPGVCTP
jgi:hypothetical protein